MIFFFITGYLYVYIYIYIYIAVNDAIKAKLYHPFIQKCIIKAPENICHIQFYNKAVELINLPRVGFPMENGI